MVTITISSSIHLEGDLPETAEDYLRKRLIFPNPEYLEAEKYDRYTGNLPETISFLQRTETGFIIPRGFIVD